MSWPRAVSVAAVVFSAVAVVCGVIGLAVAAEANSALWFVVAVIAGVPALALGVVVTRQPNPVGALLGLAGATIIATASGDVYLRAAALRPDLLPSSAAWISLSAGLWMTLFLPWALILLLFPDGRITGRFDLVVAWALPLVTVLFALLVAVSPQPYPTPFDAAPHAFGVVAGADIAAIALLPVFLGLLLACFASPVRRYRRARAAERQQLRWLALAGLSVPLTLLLCWVGLLVTGDPGLVTVGIAVMNISIPLAVGAALLRADSLDVDRAIVRALVWCLLLLALVAVITTVLALSTAVSGEGVLLSAVVATAAAVALFGPLGRWLERRLGGWLFPARARAVRALAALEQRVFAGEDRPESVQSTLRGALRDETLCVAYATHDPGQFVGGDGRALTPAPSATPVRLGGESIAFISADSAEGSSLRPIAAAAALLIEMTRLRLELAGALRDVDASRSRLLRAGYEERQRLERDLHDGAQQRLVALGMSLRLAQRQLRGDGRLRNARAGHRVDIDAVIDASVRELATAVAELRQIAHGLRPSSLDDGLHAALSNLASRSPVTVTLDLDVAELDRAGLSDAVNTTAYFVANEAVANAVKHAGARTVSVRLTQSDGWVRLRVSDDGRGGAVLSPGGGLAGLVDRVAAVGGELRISENQPCGTHIEARLPCAS